MKQVPLALLQQIFTLAVFIQDREQKIATLQCDELRALIESAGWRICAELQFPLRKIHVGHLLGAGQIQRIAQQIQLAEQEIKERDDLAEAVDFVVIDYELSPTQLFNLEKTLQKPVIDRKSLILTLFEQRAQTREARLQVHLARLYYEKPRLKRAWTHLSRQRGGRYGTRGEGETQIEIDGRLIDTQIRKLENQIIQVQKQRMQQRKKGAELAHIALVGYTNAGKSALMHAMSQKEIYVADRLFATLDPKSSQLILPNGEQVIVTDTVGFVRNLPHELIDAFRATLEETVLADLQLLVLDASDMQWQEKLHTVHQVLQDLKVDDKDQILLLNKIDLLNEEQIREMQMLFPQALLISAQERIGLELLSTELSKHLARRDLASGLDQKKKYSLEVPHQAQEAGALRAWLFQHKLIFEQHSETEYSQFFHLQLSGANLQYLRQRFPQFLSSLNPL